MEPEFDPIFDQDILIKSFFLNLFQMLQSVVARFQVGGISLPNLFLHDKLFIKLAVLSIQLSVLVMQLKICIF